MRHHPLATALIVAPLVAAACGTDVDESNTDTSTVLETVVFDTSNEVATSSLPPDFGDPCSENDDCTTGFCVEGGSGPVCTRTCVDSCPSGYSCIGITSGSADLVFVCVPDDEPPADTVQPDTSPADTSQPDTSQPDTSAPMDTAPDVGPDTLTPPTGSLCDPDPGAWVDNLKAESSDWADCIVGCSNTAQIGFNEVNLVTEAFNGALGILDDQAHAYDHLTSGSGPDIDVLPVRAPTRTMLEFAVRTASPGSPMDPLIYVSDGFQIRTFNSDVGPDNRCARTTMAFPYVGDVPIYVAVEDAINYDAFTTSGWTQSVGGPSYSYTLRIRQTPFAPIELGALSAGQTLNVAGQPISQGGQTLYYRFMAPADFNPRVTLTRTGAAAFVPAVAGFKTNDNQLVWQLVRYDDDRNGVVVLEDGFEPCVGVCGSQVVEHIFAVYDWNGDAGPGNFSYDLQIQPN